MISDKNSTYVVLISFFDTIYSAISNPEESGIFLDLLLKVFLRDKHISHTMTVNPVTFKYSEKPTLCHKN